MGEKQVTARAAVCFLFSWPCSKENTIFQLTGIPDGMQGVITNVSTERVSPTTGKNRRAACAKGVIAGMWNHRPALLRELGRGSEPGSNGSVMAERLPLPRQGGLGLMVLLAK